MLRHIFGIIVSAIFLCMTTVSFAAPTYGTKMPKAKEVFSGFQSYSILDRKIENDVGTIRSQQEFFLLSYGIADWFSLDLKGGLGNIRQHSDTQPNISYPLYLAGGYGFRVKLYDQEGTKAVVGFQHISVHPHERSLGADKHKAVLDDWQFPLVVSHDVFDWTPYAGVRWSWLNQIHWVNKERFLEKSDHNVGVIVGTDIPMTDKVWINIEGQFVDSQAVSGSVNFKF